MSFSSHFDRSRERGDFMRSHVSAIVFRPDGNFVSYLCNVAEIVDFLSIFKLTFNQEHGRNAVVSLEKQLLDCRRRYKLDA